MFFFNKNQSFYDKICTRKTYNNRKVIDKQATIKRNNHKEKKMKKYIIFVLLHIISTLNYIITDVEKLIIISHLTTKKRQTLYIKLTK